MWKGGGRVAFTLTFLCCSHAIALNELSEGDHSAEVSVELIDGRLRVVEGLLPLDSPGRTMVARATFMNTQLDDGWTKLEVVTNENVTDAVQAEAAGMAEGHLTWKFMAEYYNEFYANDICKSEPGACEWIGDQIKRNTEYVKGMNERNSATSSHWHHIGLFYTQMEGLTKGYQGQAKLQATDSGFVNLTEHEIHLINFLPDFWDMIEAYHLFAPKEGGRERRSAARRPSCSVIIKHLPEKGDIYFAHNAWHEYRAMTYRVLKKYNLNYHALPHQLGREGLVPGTTLTMSSYIGTVLSLDDFLLSSSGLATTETTLFIYDKELFRDADYTENVVFEGARVMTANRLAKDGEHWMDIFKQFNSGTYNNQWMVVDYKKLKSSPKILEDGVLWVAEQIPGKVVAKDQTDELRKKTYWSSYNRPAYPDIQSLVGTDDQISKYGDWFTHDRTARAKIFKRDHSKIKDVDTLMSLMRYNDFENDPHAIVDGCTPNRTPAGSIANRLDLASPGSNCTFSDDDWMVGHWAYGSLDAKIASKDSFAEGGLEFTAVAGPTHDQQPPFQWSTTNVEGVPEFRTIDKFDFEPVRATWSLTSSVPDFRPSLIITTTLILLGRLMGSSSP